jgi:hypothetical protein
MNADGVCDYIKKDLQKEHCQCAQTLREIDAINPKKSEYAYYGSASVAKEIAELENKLSLTPREEDKLAQLKQENCIMGEISGPKCAVYGCDKDAIIYCRYETMKQLIKEINGSKYQDDTADDSENQKSQSYLAYWYLLGSSLLAKIQAATLGTENSNSDQQ